MNDLLTYRISRLNARLNAQAIKMLSKTAGLSLAQWRILVVLDALGPSPAFELIRHTDIDKGQMSRTVKPMVAAGWLTSKTNKDNQRSAILSMTDEGRALFEKARPIMRNRQTQLTKTFSDEERKALFETIDRLEGAIEALDEDI